MDLLHDDWGCGNRGERVRAEESVEYRASAREDRAGGAGEGEERESGGAEGQG